MRFQLSLFSPEQPVTSAAGGDLSELAARFCEQSPHRQLPYARRDWGGPLHSLCSYQGKLKPAIAHFLVSWFTKEGQRILDPMAGVGTIPLEARRLGRVGIASDLSPLAVAVARAKLEPFAPGELWAAVAALEHAIETGPSLEVLRSVTDVDFGLNGPVRDYFHPQTLREVLIAREFLSPILREARYSTAYALVGASVLHILHGNRPYALSRRSHPVTPFAPSGPFEYRPLVGRLRQRLARIMDELLCVTERTRPGEAYLSDFRDLQIPMVDAVITSPPFSNSLRFWSTNWMRLWFSGWEPSDFQMLPARYLETEQRHSFAPYRQFAAAMTRALKPGGLLIMHLGETKSQNMAELVAPHLTEHFQIVFSGRESVEDGESHGIRDKGSTIAHHYLFATRR